MKTCSIAIVNFRTPDLVIDCLHALARETDAEITFRIVVVENSGHILSEPFVRLRRSLLQIPEPGDRS